MGFGYRVQRSGQQALWGVRHRSAPLGFLLFHASFFLLCAGGALLYYTRFVGSAVLTEGQQLTPEAIRIERLPPAGGMPSLDLSLVEAEARYEARQPVHLGATFRLSHGRSSVERQARVNHPARWGATSILVQRAGLAGVLWLQDGAGFTIDRVAAPATQAEDGVWVPMADGRVLVHIAPLDLPDGLPTRQKLTETELLLQIFVDEELLFDGPLLAGRTADLHGEGQLVLKEIRYWAGVLIVSERGGGLLITGFLLAVVGLTWRLLWYRREIAVTWDEDILRLVGHSEYFPHRFRGELYSILAALGAVRKSGGTSGTGDVGSEVS